MNTFKTLLIPFVFLAFFISGFSQNQRDADALVEKARIMTNKKNYISAIPLLNEAKTIYEKLGETIIIEYSDNLYLLGVCNAEHSPVQAAHYAKSASELIQRLNGKQNLRFAKASTLLGNCKFAMAEYEEALYAHKEALNTLKVIESDKHKVAKAYELCGDDYFALEEYENALKQWKNAISLSEKFSTNYDRLLDKSIAAISNNKKNKQLKKLIKLKRESDIENGRIEVPSDSTTVSNPIKKDVKPDNKKEAKTIDDKNKQNKKNEITTDKGRGKRHMNKRSLRKDKNKKNIEPNQIQYFNY